MPVERTNAGLGRVAEALFDTAPVEHWTVGGIHAWPVFRDLLTRKNHFFAQRGAPAATTAEASGVVPRAVRRMARYGGFAVDGVRTIASTVAVLGSERPVDALLLGDGVSRVVREGSSCDRFVDPIADAIEGRGGRVCVADPGPEPTARRARAALSVRAAIHAVAKLSRVGSLRAFPVHLEGYPAVVERVRAFDTALRVPTERELVEALREVHALSLAYVQLLDLVRPRAAFCVGYYGPEAMGLVVAARRRGIASVDIQHGYLEAYHRAYTGFRRVPPGGYVGVPSVFWVWGTRDRDLLRQWTEPTNGAHRVIVGGHPTLEARRRRSHGSPSPAAAALRQRAGTRRLVLYSANGFETDKELQQLASFVRGHRAEWFLLVRMHPVRAHRMGDFAAALAPFAEDAAWSEPSGLDLYDVLGVCDAHLTEGSSTAAEAAAFGVPTVLTSDAEGTFFEHLVRLGWVTTVKCFEEVPARLAAQLARRDQLEPPREVFSPSLEEALDSILGSERPSIEAPALR